MKKWESLEQVKETGSSFYRQNEYVFDLAYKQGIYSYQEKVLYYYNLSKLLAHPWDITEAKRKLRRSNG